MPIHLINVILVDPVLFLPRLSVWKEVCFLLILSKVVSNFQLNYIYTITA